VVLFCHPSEGDVIAVKEILHLFGRVSGLQVNYAKSSASLLRCSEEEAAPATEHAPSLICRSHTWASRCTFAAPPLRNYSLSSTGLQAACPLGRPV
jgi:hypothetical protein